MAVQHLRIGSWFTHSVWVLLSLAPFFISVFLIPQTGHILIYTNWISNLSPNWSILSDLLRLYSMAQCWLDDYLKDKIHEESIIAMPSLIPFGFEMQSPDKRYNHWVHLCLHSREEEMERMKGKFWLKTMFDKTRNQQFFFSESRFYRKKKSQKGLLPLFYSMPCVFNFQLIAWQANILWAHLRKSSS